MNGLQHTAMIQQFARIGAQQRLKELEAERTELRAFLEPAPAPTPRVKPRKTGRRLSLGQRRAISRQMKARWREWRKAHGTEAAE